jgi:uridine kinase
MDLVVVCGPVASGKTTYVHRNYSGGDVIVLSCDNYFVDRGDLSESARGRLNYDEPSALDRSRLCEDVQKLMARQAIDMPVYDFVSHTVVRTVRVAPEISHTTLVVEGHLAGLLLYDLFAPRVGETRWMPHWRDCIYVDTDETVCFERRLDRDPAVRGWTTDEVVEQHLAHTRPARYKYVEPQMSFASRIVVTF